MGPVFLFDLASQRARWLGLRQGAVATNVANASTPGFKALDVRPFEDVMARTGLDMSKTQAGHIRIEGSETRGKVIQQRETWETSLSGNSINLEEQILRAGEVSRNFTLNSNLVRTFHRMMLASVKG
jgi:flagellar basal-body rod protein FlgB